MSSNFGNIIQIGDILVSTDVVTEYFACDYEKCHGQCCVVGDSGAPLLEGEDEELERAYEAFSPYMTPAGRAAVDSVGFFEIDREGDMVTPVVHSPHRVPGLDYIPGTHSLAGLPGLEDCAFISYEPSGAGGEPGAGSGAGPGAEPGAIPGMSEPGAAPGAASGAVPGMSGASAGESASGAVPDMSEPGATPGAGLGSVPGMSSASAGASASGAVPGMSNASAGESASGALSGISGASVGSEAVSAGPVNCLCAVERCFFEGRCSFRKPISCRLYPIRVQRFPGGGQALNYHRWNICSDAVAKGRREGIRVFEFLREPLTDAFGPDFWDALRAAADYLSR